MLPTHVHIVIKLILVNKYEVSCTETRIGREQRNDIIKNLQKNHYNFRTFFSNKNKNIR